MKKLILLATVFFFISGTASAQDSATTNEIVSGRIETAAFGEMCGGIAGIRCASGLECKYDGNYPDAGGVCVDTVVDKKVECEPTKAPVCGLKDQQKNAYLNKCEAKRHGAKVVNEGFCKVEETVKGNCKAKAVGVGNCEAFFSGYEFSGKKCVGVSLSGCEAEIPFASLEECEIAACEIEMNLWERIMNFFKNLF